MKITAKVKCIGCGIIEKIIPCKDQPICSKCGMPMILLSAQVNPIKKPLSKESREKMKKSRKEFIERNAHRFNVSVKEGR